MSVRAAMMIAAGLASAISMAAPAVTAAAESEGQITILYDAFGTDAAMTKDWGFSALLEVAGKRILFDTGDNADIFAANVKAKDVDLVIARVTTSLKDKFKVENVAPGHCTGEPMFAALKKAFGDRYHYAGLGTSLPLASTAGSGMRRGEVPELDDFAIYRKLASREDQN